jgi:hypothetical protein
MSGQTHTGPREDAANKRREYVWKKTVSKTFLYFLLWLAAFLTLAMCFELLLLPAIARGALPQAAQVLRQYPRMSALIGALVGAVLPALIGVIGLARRQRSIVKSIPYVPPVAQQIAALPADEVLLRGSDPPTVALDELLRAATGGTETAAGELLRPDGQCPARRASR